MNLGQDYAPAKREMQYGAFQTPFNKPEWRFGQIGLPLRFFALVNEHHRHWLFQIYAWLEAEGR